MKLSNKQKKDNFIKYISSKDALFHYTKRAIALEEILYKNSFKFSKLTNTNDPYEYKNKHIISGGYSINEEKKDETKKFLDEIIEKQTSFISFCTNTFNNGSLRDHGFIKSRMWSQYGESHKGICLVFSKDKLLKAIEEKLRLTNCELLKDNVNYEEYLRNDMLSLNHDTFDNSSTEDVAFEYIKNNQKKLFFTKQKDYKDEDEYRFVLLHKDAKISHSMEAILKVKDFLQGIIVGDRFPKIYNPSIESIVKDTDIMVKKLSWRSGEYRLLSI